MASVQQLLSARNLATPKEAGDDGPALSPILPHPARCAWPVCQIRVCSAERRHVFPLRGGDVTDVSSYA